MKKRDYKAVIFDLDGTLINSLPYHFLAFKDLLLEHNIRIDDSHLKKLIGLSTRNILAELKKKYKFKETVVDLREERRYHYFKFLGERDITFAGVKKVLRDLRLNKKLAIATGSSRVTFAHSTDKDFQEMFDVVITINDVKNGKPHPEQLIKAAKKMKVKPSECLVIGDSIYDCMAAKAAKMDSVGVLTGFTSEKELKKAGAMIVLSGVNKLGKII
jgi:HAD superfamily hydrolase (TIGR01509 family)